MIVIESPTSLGVTREKTLDAIVITSPNKSLPLYFSKNLFSLFNSFIESNKYKLYNF